MQHGTRAFQKLADVTKTPHPAPSPALSEDTLLQRALDGENTTAFSPGVVRSLSKLVGNQAAQRIIQRALGITVGAPPAIQRDTADDISRGHAWTKHKQDEGLWPHISTKAEFAALIRDVIANPDGSKNLARGRVVYIKGNNVVITDPASRDGGTCFTNSNPSAKMARLA